MIKLVITDMDGTFLNNEGAFNKELFTEVAHLMQRQGVHFAPCTGKQCERIEELFTPELSEDFWILGDSATRIKHDGRFVYESLLPNALGQQIITRLQEIHTDYTIIACTPACAYVLDNRPEIDKKMIRGSYANVQTIDSFQEISEDFVKITVYDSAKRSFETYNELSSFYAQAYIVASEASWIDITNKGVHKGTTIRELQYLLAVSPAETMVFGDGLNDLELMQAGEFSFAMRNAFDETKAAARYITGTNEEDSVLHTIKQFLSLQEIPVAEEF